MSELCPFLGLGNCLGEQVRVVVGGKERPHHSVIESSCREPVGVTSLARIATSSETRTRRALTRWKLPARFPSLWNPGATRSSATGTPNRIKPLLCDQLRASLGGIEVGSRILCRSGW